MSSYRDTIMDALLDRLVLKCGDTFKYYTRRFMTWEQMIANRNEMNSIEQPALFLYDGVGLGGGVDLWSPRRASGQIVTMDKTIVIYATLPGGTVTTGQDGTTPGGNVFNPLIESVEAAMAPDDPSQGVLTLGGLVSHCWLEGEGLMMTGELDQMNGQGMQTIPVKILFSLSQSVS